MTETFLRRAPKTSPRARSRRAARAVVAGAAVCVFAVLDARSSARFTALTREIQEQKATVLSLESELGYAVRLEGAIEGREAALAALERESGFVAPDSGCVVQVRSNRHER